jgi:hypothetical protein
MVRTGLITLEKFIGVAVQVERTQTAPLPDVDAFGWTAASGLSRIVRCSYLTMSEEKMKYPSHKCIPFITKYLDLIMQLMYS